MPLSAGFSLVELIIVILIVAVIAVSLTVMIRPALDAYVDTRVRGEMSDQADTALRRMLRDVRQAVPNSIRIPNARCFELIPSSGGGRYRTGPDTSVDAVGCAPAANCSAPLDPSAGPTTVFDSLTQLSTVPSNNDWVVINNQNGNDVYAGTNRARISNVLTPAPGGVAQGQHRISIDATQFSQTYAGGRYMVVPNNQQAVFYVCEGADGTLDANGNGKGTLFRLRNYGFNAAYPADCPATAGADVVARRIQRCTFIYDANQGATQQSGFIWMELTITRNNETAHLATGGHVLNSP